MDETVLFWKKKVKHVRKDRKGLILAQPRFSPETEVCWSTKTIIRQLASPCVLIQSKCNTAKPKPTAASKTPSYIGWKSHLTDDTCLLIFSNLFALICLLWMPCFIFFSNFPMSVVKYDRCNSDDDLITLGISSFIDFFLAWYDKHLPTSWRLLSNFSCKHLREGKEKAGGEASKKQTENNKSNRIHGTGIFTYIYHTSFIQNVGIHASPMEHMRILKNPNAPNTWSKTSVPSHLEKLKKALSKPWKNPWKPHAQKALNAIDVKSAQILNTPNIHLKKCLIPSPGKERMIDGFV